MTEVTMVDNSLVVLVNREEGRGEVKGARQVCENNFGVPSPLPYKVLWEETEQNYDGSETTQWCSDGLIRCESFYAYSSEPTDGGSTELKVIEPTWITNSHQELKISEMTETHRRNCLKLNYAREHEAIASLGLFDYESDFDNDPDPAELTDEALIAKRIQAGKLTEALAYKFKGQKAISQFWINVFKKSLGK